MILWLSFSFNLSTTNHYDCRKPRSHDLGFLQFAVVPKNITERLRRQADSERLARQASDELKRHQKWFLECLFSVLAKLAKADGMIDEQEVRIAERVFERYPLAEQMREYCCGVFNRAKKSSKTIYWYAGQFGDTQNADLCIYIYDLLWDVALADGYLHPAEKEILLNICDSLRISRGYFDVNYKRHMGSFVEGDKNEKKRNDRDGATHSDASTKQYVSRKSSISDAYEILECGSAATDDELRSAYHKMAKRYHPDALRANGVPEEMILFATQRMVQINAAWQDIRRHRQNTEQ